MPGGPADKLGNRYEKWWTISQFVRMLQGHAEAIRIEDPGVQKTEFVVTTGSRRELHQVKRSHPNGKWTLAALQAEGLFDAIGEQLAGNDDRFVFASTSDARDLADLCEAARSAKAPEELQGVFLKAGARRANFASLLKAWKCDEHAAMDYLRRIDVYAIDDRQLAEKVTWGIRALFLANPMDVADALRGIAEDSVHRTVTRPVLVDDLSRRRYPLRRLISPASAGVAVQTATQRYLDGARRRLIRKELVPRQATQTLLSRLGDTATESVMTGGAGSGKTACVVELVDALRNRSLPVLAFRLDRVSTASTTDELGRLLDLEESPALVLAAAAKAARCSGVLIVDQLDAVSTVSGRNSAAFDLVEQLLLEARGSRAQAAIHVVVVCREFDWENDSRLRRLLPESHAQVDVTEFSDDEVKKILTGEGFEVGAFRDRQLRVLRLPQNLALFLRAGFDAARTPAFNTATEILDRYWAAKRRSVADRASGASDQWMAVMTCLCQEMTSTQQLSVRKETLDAFSPDYLDQLASEGVLSFDGHRYGFGHESFFDYVFARLFVTRSESVVAFLKTSEQHLFRRGQVRQVLAYLREADPARYVRQLRDLLSDDGIRPHLKDLVLALLAEVPNPTDAEWALWETWTRSELTAIEKGMASPEKLSALAWRRFFTSRSWFSEMDRRGVVERWLASNNDRLTDMAVNYLRFHQRHAPDRVAALLEPYADRDGKWQLRLRFLMERAEHHTNRRFFDLFLRLLDNGALDEARDRFATNGTFWSMLYRLGEGRPDWVPEVLARRLRRRLADMRATREERSTEPLPDYDESATRLVTKAVEHAPARFVEHVLPVVLEISNAAATGETPPRRDDVWPLLFKSEHLSVEDACLSGLADALEFLGCPGTVQRRAVVTELRGRDTYVANYLLQALYRGGAAQCADEAVVLLCDEPWRLECGFSDSSNWCAMETIAAVVPCCTTENRARLEAVILKHVPRYERSLPGYRQFGRTQLDLLSAFPEKLRSKVANARFGELTRKFGDPAPPPRGIVFDSVKSPIAKEAAKRMTDEQWLRAMAKYAAENGIAQARGELTGGAWELARELEERVKEVPDRFVRLGLRFPSDVNPVYLERTLGALKDAAVSSELKLALCRKACAEARGSCGRSIADVLGRMDVTLPDDVVNMLDRLATGDNDPAEELWRKDAKNGQANYDGDPYFQGINTTRGRAVGAIGDLIRKNTEYVARFRMTLDRMVRDPSAAVRSCVAGTLRAVTSHDAALGMTLFRSMDLSEDRLLATHHVQELIRYGLSDWFLDLRPIIERMLGSSEPGVREAGARLACIGALRHESAADLVDRALRSDVRGRLGVARVAAANIADKTCRAWCEATVVRLFGDADAEVRRKAASCFGYLTDADLHTSERLVAAFCDSPAFEEGAFWLLRVLEESKERLPGTTCAVCKKYLDRMADTDLRTGQFADAYTVVKLIFRSYQQHENDQWTATLLDLIDRLCVEGMAEAGSELEKFER